MDFAAALAAEVGADVSGGATDHPDVDTWAAYAARRTGAGEAERLRDHLVECAACRELVAQIQQFQRVESTPEADRTRAPADRVDEVMAAVLPRGTDQRSGGMGKPRTPGKPGTAWVLGLAASVALLLVAGLIVWSLGLRGQVEELEERLAAASEPSARVAVVDLHPASVSRQGGGEGTGAGGGTGIAATGTTFATWVVHLPAGVDAHSYAVELRDADGGTVWQRGEVEADPRFHNLLVGTPAGALEPGRYTLLVRELPADDDAWVGEYPLEVRPP